MEMVEIRITRDVLTKRRAVIEAAIEAGIDLGDEISHLAELEGRLKEINLILEYVEKW